MLKTQICVTRPQCVNINDFWNAKQNVIFLFMHMFMPTYACLYTDVWTPKVWWHILNIVTLSVMCRSVGIQMVHIFVLDVVKHMQHYMMWRVASVFVQIISCDCRHFSAHCYSQFAMSQGPHILVPYFTVTRRFLVLKDGARNVFVKLIVYCMLNFCWWSLLCIQLNAPLD